VRSAEIVVFYFLRKIVENMGRSLRERNEERNAEPGKESTTGKRKVAGENGGNMWSAKINGVLQ